MKTVKDIYAEATIFTDDVEEYAEAQVKMICDNETAAGSRICMMPDINLGRIAPIGLSMTVTDRVIPQLLGVDIGCGMTCVKLNKSNAEFQKLDRVIRENIPSGFSIRKTPHHMTDEFCYDGLHCVRHINRQKAERSLGTLGGGNHFIELDKSAEGALYLVVHTGSRHLGEEAAEQFSVPHNYLDDAGILRKGAISAREGERVVIPANMKEGTILGIGKGNAEWNDSAPHGSGRRWKREDVKKQYTVSEFKKEMAGIYSSCVGADTLDEAPFAYRSVMEIAEKIRDTVEITEILKPVYNFKAGSKK